MARVSPDSSKRHFHWTKKVGNEEDEPQAPTFNPNSDEKKENSDTHFSVAPTFNPKLEEKPENFNTHFSVSSKAPSYNPKSEEKPENFNTHFSVSSKASSFDHKSEEKSENFNTHFSVSSKASSFNQKSEEKSENSNTHFSVLSKSSSVNPKSEEKLENFNPHFSVSSKAHTFNLNSEEKSENLKTHFASLSKASTFNLNSEEKRETLKTHLAVPTSRRKIQAVAVSRLRSVLSAFGKNRSGLGSTHALGPRVVGTLFGNRRGHVHFAFQKDPTSPPALLVELATPISGLVKEMASGLVRIALECDKAKEDEKKPAKLLEEKVWRTYCNGKKSGFATRRECGPKDWKILKAVEMISMGAGVLPATGEDGSAADGEIMYMRAKFERIVGSRDSEAFYMMNPDSNGAPELSIYLLRV